MPLNDDFILIEGAYNLANFNWSAWVNEFTFDYSVKSTRDRRLYSQINSQPNRLPRELRLLALIGAMEL